jgi:hypothetical protein|tara:strand:+ start:502 stop:810 length:309 start_codon:yes stop_codon:yes gene_type:complete
MASEIHQYDIGTRFLITLKDNDVAVDVSSGVRQINIRRPDDTTLNKSGSIISSGSALSGIMYYDTIAGDLDEVGHYKLQAKVSLPSGTYYTDIYTFKVHCNL